ncbi:MAG: sulfotransferase [Bradymonadaceae bacterium]
MSRIDLGTQQMVFVLGVERSGSTWLANILESSPQLLLYMEPFTEVTDLFRGFPDRLSYMESAGPLVGDQIVETLAGLPRYKYYGLESRDAASWRKRLNWRVQSVLRELYDRLGAGQNRSRMRHRELNLNRVDNPDVFAFAKSAHPTHVAIKELRLNLKVPVLAEVFPNWRTLVIIRNPIAQIDSILRQFEHGNLVYLRRFLDVLYEVLCQQSRFAKYTEPIDHLPDDDLIARAITYWFVHYSTLLEDLRETDSNFRVVRHETLCEQPMTETESLFAFAGLDCTDQTRDYVRTSSQTSVQSAEPTETTRQSDQYYRRALAEVPDDTRERMRRYAEDFWSLAPEPVRVYRDWLGDHL